MCDYKLTPIFKETDYTVVSCDQLIRAVLRTTMKLKYVLCDRSKFLVLVRFRSLTALSARHTLIHGLLAAGCHSKALAAAWSSSHGSSLLGVPPNGGPLIRLTSGLDGDNSCGAKVCPRQDRRSIKRETDQRAAAVGGTPRPSVSDCLGTQERVHSLYLVSHSQ